MSEKFVQITLPCNECLVNSMCKSQASVQKIEKEDALLQIKDLNATAFGIKRWDESQKCWKKGLIELWANMGYNVLVRDGSNDSHYKGYKENKPVFVNFLNQLAQIIEYTIHSTSWNQGEPQPFDIDEIKRKLNIAKTLLR